MLKLYLSSTFRSQDSGDLPTVRGEGYIFENDSSLHATSQSLEEAAWLHLYNKQ